MLTRFLILAFILGFSGTIIESSFSTFKDKKLTYSGDKFFWNFPSKPIYSIGGLILFFSIKLFNTRSWYIKIIMSTLLIILWEYISGVFCVTVFKRRFWDYSDKKANLQGHVCWWSAEWWLIITTAFYLLFYKQVLRFENYLNYKVSLSSKQDIVVFTAVMLIVLLLTVFRGKSVRETGLEPA